MKIKFPFRQYIVQALTTFLVGLAVLGFTFYYSFNTKLRPTPQETIALFIAAPYQNEKIHDAWDTLKSSLSDHILRFDLFTSDPADDNFKAAYQYRGRSSDVLVLPEHLLNDDLSLFWDIPNEDAYHGKGILVHSADEKVNGMGSYFVYQSENYYAFFNTSSLHVSSLDAAKGDNEAFALVEGLLSH